MGPLNWRGWLQAVAALLGFMVERQGRRGLVSCYAWLDSFMLCGSRQRVPVSRVAVSSASKNGKGLQAGIVSRRNKAA